MTIYSRSNRLIMSAWGLDPSSPHPSESTRPDPVICAHLLRSATLPPSSIKVAAYDDRHLLPHSCHRTNSALRPNWPCPVPPDVWPTMLLTLPTTFTCHPYGTARGSAQYRCVASPAVHFSLSSAVRRPTRFIGLQVSSSRKVPSFLHRSNRRSRPPCLQVRWIQSVWLRSQGL